MARKTPVYGLDIETDTTVDGLDPGVAPGRTVALAMVSHDETVSGRESTMLVDLDQSATPAASLEPTGTGLKPGGSNRRPIEIQSVPPPKRNTSARGIVPA